jgi:pyridoxine kinase
LQLLGFEVDPINSCQLSNHTGYKTFSGSRTQGAELDQLLVGMTANNFFEQYTVSCYAYSSTAIE